MSVSGGSSGILKSPTDAPVDSTSNIYVADYGNNRVLTFPPLVFLSVAGGTPISVVGQRDFTGTTPNGNVTNGGASSDGLYAPLGLYIDRQDTLYVGDTGNNRVLHFLKPVVVVNSATFQPGIPVASGGLAAMFGRALTEGEETTSGAALANDSRPTRGCGE